MKPIGEGRTAEVFEYGEGAILKLYRQSFPADAIRYEFEVSKLANALGIATPAAYELVEREQRTGIVFRRIDGATLLHLMTQQPRELERLSRVMADLHLDMHRRQLPHAELDSLPIRGQKEVLAHNIRGAELLSGEEKETVLRSLEQLPEGRCVCHGDYHPDNVMVGEQEWIIDWMNGTLGHPAGDVARTLVLFRFGTLPEGAPEPVKEALRLMRSRFAGLYRERYLHASGLAPADIDAWMLPVAAARLVEWIPGEEKEALLAAVRERLV
jgi:uncharacterized protein (TIGR02172 family)